MKYGFLSSPGNVKEVDWVGLCAKLILGLFLFYLVLFGACIGVLAFAEPDTCFLAATGRWIIEHGHLPLTDPFSYTAALASSKDFILHQWLTEVIFYTVIRWFGLSGLLITAAIIVSISFVIIPLEILKKADLSKSAMLIVIAILLFAVCPRAVARPDLFSFFLFGCCLQLLLALETTHGISAKSISLYVAVFVMIVAIWCNLHSGFMSGLALLIVWAILCWVERIFLHRPATMALLVTSIATPLCFMASFANPYGWKLWRYMLNCFASSEIMGTVEMQRLNWDSLGKPYICAFIILAICCLYLCLKKWRQSNIRNTGLKSQALVLWAIIAGFSAQRMIPFACLLLLAALNLASIGKKAPADNSFSKEPGPTGTLLHLIDGQISQILNSGNWFWLATCLSMVVMGVVLIKASDQIVLPADTRAFHPPFQAMHFLEKNPQSGNLFNDAHFGDSMMWNMRSCPPLFIDSRFDVYDTDILQKYRAIINSDAGWQGDLNQFDIKWVFVPLNWNVARSLSSNPDWVIRYKDKDSVIFRRNR